MADNSDISWTNATWPLVVGCNKKDRGCSDCYAITIAWVRGHNGNPAIGPIFDGLVEKLPDGTLNWTGLVKSLDERLRWPIERWSRPLLTGHPERLRGMSIFLTSMGDIWHDHVSTDFLAFTYAVMAHTPWHSYLVLTKRWDRARDTLSDPRFVQRVADFYDELAAEYGWHVEAGEDMEWPLPNVVAMASASVQSELETMLPALLRTPAVMHGVSLEPLLGPLDLALAGAVPVVTHCPPGPMSPESAAAFRQIVQAAARHLGTYPLDWVITGGKSGGKKSRRHEWLVEKCNHFLPEYEYWTVADSCRFCASLPDPGHSTGFGRAGTGWRPKQAALAWVTSLRDQCATLGIPFHFKQFGGPTAGAGGRLLDGRFHDDDLGLPVFNPETRKWRYPTMNPVCEPKPAFAEAAAAV